MLTQWEFRRALRRPLPPLTWEGDNLREVQYVERAAVVPLKTTSASPSYYASARIRYRLVERV